MKSISIIIFLLGFSHLSFGQNQLSDTNWTHTMKEADLILEIKVIDRSYMTERGDFECEITKVVKGKCSMSRIILDLELIETSRIRFEKRFRTIMDKDNPRIGFTKSTEWYWYPRVKIDGDDYGFFMSE